MIYILKISEKMLARLEPPSVPSCIFWDSFGRLWKNMRNPCCDQNLYSINKLLCKKVKKKSQTVGTGSVCGKIMLFCHLTARCHMFAILLVCLNVLICLPPGRSIQCVGDGSNVYETCIYTWLLYQNMSLFDGRGISQKWKNLYIKKTPGALSQLENFLLFVKILAWFHFYCVLHTRTDGLTDGEHRHGKMPLSIRISIFFSNPNMFEKEMTRSKRLAMLQIGV